MRLLTRFPYSLLWVSAAICILFFNCSKKGNTTTPTVYIKKTWKGYELIRNGKCFYIKGASGDSHFKELSDAGANTIRIYDTTRLKIKLDQAHKLGLAVIMDLPVPRLRIRDTIYNNPIRVERLKARIKDFVDQYKNHPAVLYWILGNEIEYPDLPGNKHFYSTFNDLIDLVHQIDPNHPVSTAVPNINRSQVLSMAIKSPKIDLLSINTFGHLSSLQKRMATIALLWKGPYVFTEWGINGPWEAQNTTWGAPIEQTSTKKAEHYTDRYTKYINGIKDNRCLGSLVFYWGQKQERTHTWYSLFSETGVPTQSVFALENLWKNRDKTFKGVALNYMLINQKGAPESIVLLPETQNNASLFLNKSNTDSIKIRWEIRPENWYYFKWDKERKTIPLSGLISRNKGASISFQTPVEEGPYRLFVYVEDSSGYMASTNTPFYVLAHTHEK